MNKLTGAFFLSSKGTHQGITDNTSKGFVIAKLMIQRDNCDSRGNNNVTCECLLSYMQALFVGDSYFFKRTGNNVERRETNKVILRLQVLTTVLRSLWKLTSETYCNIIIYMEVFKPKHCVQWRAFKKGGSLYCIWWLLKEPCYIQVTEVTFHCCRGVCRGNPLRYNSFL